MNNITMYKSTKAPDGYITGMIVGDIIAKNLRKTGIAHGQTFYEVYEAIFRLVRKTTPSITNGITGHGKKYYYDETKALTLINKAITAFEKDGLEGFDKLCESFSVRSVNDKEFVGQIIDVFEDFLVKKKAEFSDDTNEDSKNGTKTYLYGQDYDYLSDRLNSLINIWKSEGCLELKGGLS